MTLRCLRLRSLACPRGTLRLLDSERRLSLWLLRSTELRGLRLPTEIRLGWCRLTLRLATICLLRRCTEIRSGLRLGLCAIGSRGLRPEPAHNLDAELFNVAALLAGASQNVFQRDLHEVPRTRICGVNGALQADLAAVELHQIACAMFGVVLGLVSTPRVLHEFNREGRADILVEIDATCRSVFEHHASDVLPCAKAPPDVSTAWNLNVLPIWLCHL